MAQDEKLLHRKLTGSMIGCACEVIHELGSGFLESLLKKRRSSPGAHLGHLFNDGPDPPVELKTLKPLPKPSC